MYFKNFPNIIYEFTIKGKDTAIHIKDITRNIRFRRDVLANITVYDEYDIVDHETPEHIAEKIYGNPEYHWIIMLVNERYDYKVDFPLPLVSLENYIYDKYGIEQYAIHHYENEKGFVVNSDYPNASSISNYDFESAVNETKRRIKIVPSYLIDQILSEYKKII